MLEKHILITGRPGSGKTQILIAIANMYPKTTLFFSEEQSEKHLKTKSGLSTDVRVVHSDGFVSEDLNKYSTVMVDYIELLSSNIVHKLVKVIEENKLRVIIVSQVRRGENEVIKRFEELMDRKS